jgi:RNA recognition motif-containing protein
MTIRADPASSSSRPTKKRRRSSIDEQKKAMIKEALRLDQLRHNMKKRESCFIYVGNVCCCHLFSRLCFHLYLPSMQIPPTATEAALRLHFRKCGPIEDICIRCSSGAAVLVGQAHPNRTPHDRQYATIVFARPKAVAKALKLNGFDMNGFKIRVNRLLKSCIIKLLADFASRCVLALRSCLSYQRSLDGA